MNKGVNWGLEPLDIKKQQQQNQTLSFNYKHIQLNS